MEKGKLFFLLKNTHLEHRLALFALERALVAVHSLNDSNVSHFSVRVQIDSHSFGTVRHAGSVDFVYSVCKTQRKKT